MRLSAVLAVRDEKRMLPGCLAQLGFADEVVVVVDARSTDRTAEIARKHTERVYERNFADFSDPKNFAIAQARGDWILVVDADERVTPALAREIDAELSSNPVEQGFRVTMASFFLGSRLEHGGWSDTPLRLVRREHAVYSNAIHESFDVPEPVGSFTEPLWHFSHRSIEEMLRKTIAFGGVQADELYAQGAPRVTTRTLFRTVGRELVYRLVRQRGYRDGVEGVIESLYQPFSLFCVQVMLWQRQLRPSLEERYELLEERARQDP